MSWDDRLWVQVNRELHWRIEALPTVDGDADREQLISEIQWLQQTSENLQRWKETVDNA